MSPLPHRPQCSFQLLQKGPGTEFSKWHFSLLFCSFVAMPRLLITSDSPQLQEKDYKTNCTKFATVNFKWKALISKVQMLGILELIFS